MRETQEGCPALFKSVNLRALKKLSNLFSGAKRIFRHAKRNSVLSLFLLYLCEQNCKPGSVSDSHLSRRTVAGTLKPPRERPGKPWGRSPCSHTGVAPNRVYSDGYFHAPSGELLPRLSTLTASSQASYPFASYVLSP